MSGGDLFGFSNGLSALSDLLNLLGPDLSALNGLQHFELLSLRSVRACPERSSTNL